MSKYYVQSGDFKVVVDAPDKLSATCMAFSKLRPRFVLPTLKGFVRVSEHGFTKEKGDKLYFTKKILKACKLLDRYEKK